ASPLILKAMWTGNGYAPVALLLPHPHINTMAIKLENSANASNPNLPQTLSNENWWSARAADAMTGSPMDNPLRGRTGDVLNDFMEFYRR
ncbi:MAG: hypothetical protein M0036_04190, partial [Desulfobacteraceae bacterium]|nr:hypothetical protein [Desulfobacteraceae bacterium]